MHDGTTRRYDVTITVDRDGGDHPNPAESPSVSCLPEIVG
jgi:hypothetical protein